MSSKEAARRAAATLERAFAQHDSSRDDARLPRIGLFGNGVPETLIAAAGAVPVHLSFGIATTPHAIAAIIEPFVDEEVRNFLIRLMSGAFSDYRGIVFSRDDAPALIAYHYASEWIRQHPGASATPPLFLWNLVHSDTPPVRAFNTVQAEKLFGFLAAQGLKSPTGADIAAASSDERQRIDLLDRLAFEVPATLSGTTASTWRNAGRFMPATTHAQLLKDALGACAPREQGHRIGLVGSPLACRKAYGMIETFGTVVCDQHGFGAVWPSSANGEPRLDGMLVAIAADRACPRVTPAGAYRANLVRKLVAANCHLVVCQLSQTDDTFGWDVPALASAMAAHGIGFINLGFRDIRPNDAWLARSSSLIAQALEARP